MQKLLPHGSETVHQFLFAFDSDVVRLPVEGLPESDPRGLVAGDDARGPIGEGELERGVHLLRGLVQVSHQQDAVIILAEDQIDTAAEPGEENDAATAEPSQQHEEWYQRQDDALAKSHVQISWRFRLR